VPLSLVVLGWHVELPVLVASLQRPSEQARFTAHSALLEQVSLQLFTVMPPCPGVGVGEGLGDGLGVGFGETTGVGEGLGDIEGVGDGVGVGVGVGTGAGQASNSQFLSGFLPTVEPSGQILASLVQAGGGVVSEIVIFNGLTVPKIFFCSFVGLPASSTIY